MADVLIERLAREAGMDPPGGVFPRWGADDAALRRFAALVADRAARLAEEPGANMGADLASEIRAMFKEDPACMNSSIASPTKSA
jgi:hypothetical protein